MNIAERKRVSDVFTNDKFPDFCFPESRGGGPWNCKIILYMIRVRAGQEGIFDDICWHCILDARYDRIAINIAWGKCVIRPRASFISKMEMHSTRTLSRSNIQFHSVAIDFRPYILCNETTVNTALQITISSRGTNRHLNSRSVTLLISTALVPVVYFTCASSKNSHSLRWVWC